MTNQEIAEINRQLDPLEQWRQGYQQGIKSAVESINEMTNANITLSSVDTLGELLARIAELTAKADAIKDQIKDSASLGGAKVVEGELFKATYIESNRKVTDWKALAEEFGIPDEAVLKHTKVSAIFSVKVTSR